MNLGEYLKTLKKSSKSADIPGTVEKYLDEECPLCGMGLKLMKPCCSSREYRKECVCGYKVIVAPDRN